MAGLLGDDVTAGGDGKDNSELFVLIGFHGMPGMPVIRRVVYPELESCKGGGVGSKGDEAKGGGVERRPDSTIYARLLPTVGIVEMSSPGVAPALMPGRGGAGIWDGGAVGPQEFCVG